MAKTREIRKRIASVRNIHKITRTMERVAQSKAMKLTGRFEHARSFRADIGRLLPESLGVSPGAQEGAERLARHPLAAVRAPMKRVLLFCVTSSRGLCGGYNARVIQFTLARMAALKEEGRETLLAVMGRKGLAYFRYHDHPVAMAMPDVEENMPFAHVDEIGRAVFDRFLAREFDAVEVIATRYRTKILQEVVAGPFLPFTIAAAGPDAPRQVPTLGPDLKPLYIVEPDRDRVIGLVVPLLLTVELFRTILEAMLCEQAQRSIAMRSASDNADSMTKRLTRTYNRVRQAQITSEMIEIIGGSEGGRT
jgi:F-type H+-transporting ATPase subunit gamma